MVEDISKLIYENKKLSKGTVLTKWCWENHKNAKGKEGKTNKIKNNQN